MFRPAAALLILWLTLLSAGMALLIRDSQTSNPLPQLADKQALVARLGLTDLALFTEARYTRHPSQTDLHSAFQDHPAALEHFPSGALLPPPHDSLAGKTSPSD